MDRLVYEKCCVLTTWKFIDFHVNPSLATNGNEQFVWVIVGYLAIFFLNSVSYKLQCCILDLACMYAASLISLTYLRSCGASSGNLIRWTSIKISNALLHILKVLGSSSSCVRCFVLGSQLNLPDCFLSVKCQGGEEWPGR